MRIGPSVTSSAGYQQDDVPAIEVRDSEDELERDEDGEQLPLDLHILRDNEYRPGTGPKLYAAYNGPAPGLYDKMSAFEMLIRSTDDIKFKKWNNERSAARSLQRAGIHVQVEPAFSSAQADEYLSAALEGVRLTDGPSQREELLAVANSTSELVSAQASSSAVSQNGQARASSPSRSESLFSEHSTYTLLGNSFVGNIASQQSATGHELLSLDQRGPPPRYEDAPSYEDVPSSQPQPASSGGPNTPPATLIATAQPAPPALNAVTIAGSVASGNDAAIYSTAQVPAPAPVQVPAPAPTPVQAPVPAPAPVLNQVSAQASAQAPPRVPRLFLPVPLVDLLSRTITPYGPLSYRTRPPTSFSYRNPCANWTPPNDYTPPMNRGPEWRGPVTTYPFPDDTPDEGEDYAWSVVIRGPRVGIYRHRHELEAVVQEAWKFPSSIYQATEVKKFQLYLSAVLYFCDHRGSTRLEEFVMPPPPPTDLE